MCKVEVSGPVVAALAVLQAAQTRTDKVKRFNKVNVMNAIVCIGGIASSDALEANFINSQ